MPSAARPRIDLDGVTLCDEANALMPLAMFRYRTVDGLLVLIPESGELLVPWSEIESAALDLASGEVRIRLRQAYLDRESWARGARTLLGKWIDRVTLTAAPR